MANLMQHLTSEFIFFVFYKNTEHLNFKNVARICVELNGRQKRVSDCLRLGTQSTSSYSSRQEYKFCLSVKF